MCLTPEGVKQVFFFFFLIKFEDITPLFNTAGNYLIERRTGMIQESAGNCKNKRGWGPGHDKGHGWEKNNSSSVTEHVVSCR